MATTPRDALNALQAFLEAASKLDRCYHEVLDAGYPESLPSFDEFVNDVALWRDTVRKRMATLDISEAMNP